MNSLVIFKNFIISLIIIIMLKQFYEQNKIEVGLDEAGRGCLFGPVCVGAVIWLDEDPIQDDKNYEIKDSKKCSPKIRSILRKYI